MDNSGREKTTAKEVVLTDGIRQNESANIEKKKTVGEYASEIFFCLLYALWGYLLGGFSLPFGATPFGVALLCAAKGKAVFIFFGLCASAVFKSNAIAYIIVYSSVILIRILVTLVIDVPWEEKDGKEIGEKTFFEARGLFFNERLALRMSTACVGALAIGVYRLIQGGFLYYDLYGALLSLIIAPIAAALFASLFEKHKKDSVYRTAGFIALSAVLVLASRKIEIFHVSAAAFGALFASLYITRRESTVKGVLAGAVLGLCYSPSLSPLFAFGALCGGIVFPLSATLGTLVTFCSSAAWAIYTQGISTLSGLLPAILSASVIYAIIDKLFLSEKLISDNTNDKTSTNESFAKDIRKDICSDEAMINAARLYDTKEKLVSVRESFRELSQIFESIGDTLKNPNVEDLRRICDNAFDSSCAGCSQKEMCWDKNYRKTDSEISGICSVLHKKGSISTRDASSELCARCPRLPDIVDEINHNATSYVSRLLQHDKTEIFANDYATVSDILFESEERSDSEYENDKQLSKQLCEAFLLSDDISQKIVAIAVWGQRKKRIALQIDKASHTEKDNVEILRIVESVCEKRFFIEKKESASDEYDTLVLCEARKLKINFVSRILRADGEDEYCGDAVGAFYNKEDRFYAFISDGMGAGHDAAVTSGICALFLRKMLSAGSGCESTLRMINGFLRNKGNGSLHECSATVDLCEIDLLCKKASFCKSGAAPTYIFRDGGLFKIRSKTLPVGILKEPDTNKIGFDIDSGDVVVMVSDGITQGREDCPWLFDLLRGNISTLGIEKTADLIVDHAKKEGSSDDISVLILKVDKA